MKSVYAIVRKACADNRIVGHTHALFSRQLSSRSLLTEARKVPLILSDTNSIDEFQYFSMKIKDLMDKEQLEYFENVIKKVENINHPIADLMKFVMF